MTRSDPDERDEARRAVVEASPDSSPARSGARLRLVLLVVLLVVAVGSAGTLATLLLRRGTDSQPERDAVMAVAREFVQRVNTYGPDQLDATTKTMPSYRSAVEQLVTPKFKTSFLQSVTLPESRVAGSGLTVKGSVLGAGVDSLDADSASVLVPVAIDASVKDDKGKTVKAPPQLGRFVVSLVRIDGRWLVDDFTDVRQLQQGAGGDGTTGQDPLGGATDGTGGAGGTAVPTPSSAPSGEATP
ncbi:hypothetical protein K8Z61_12045 [Nocardioides sp. TRM66260-LWL]|uniref:hypothetical protein n=1 Tax=Nocardioides sp. TRM66260-LWL TaxID=2874478 RepID=UPI001CC4FF71|nr:hypothetical protein [Nocardioides sp. TRM66260-LWL]MBZ5735228.1 hypothetical protein [Nocardioides sp. TRM66260-LWL]